jgi:3-deoxy-7-phosphoheptulonate synthase
MIIVLKPEIDPHQIKAIEADVESKGGSPILIEGKERCVVAVVGVAKLDHKAFEMLPGVAQVMRVGKPYKLASREVKPENTMIDLDGLIIGGSQVVVMAGPCAVESREMVLETAQKLSQMGVTILRGGAFKPRTNPYSFQGLKEEGLKYLAEAREATGMKVITEVMSAEKVKVVAEHSDILQIGARNMQNFDLLRACSEVKNPVLLKRGISATIDEWLQASEYILAKNPRVILCERGIRTFETATRNTLDLNAIPVLRERTHLPIIVDPSHGTGVRSYVKPMALAALAAGADGIMVEVHPHPEKALSDGPQSLTPEMLEHLLRDLEVIAPVVGRQLGLARKHPDPIEVQAKSDAIAFQGETGAFSEKALIAYFGEKVNTLSCPDFRDVFEKVESGECPYGIIPLENSLAGSVHPNFHHLLEYNISIVGELKLRVVHNLIAHPGTKIEDLRKVYAHPQAAAQCERFLRGHADWSVLQVYDTAGSVKMIRDEKILDGAAIASKEAAEEFGLEVLSEGIENDPQNYTRFIVLAKESVANRDANKVSIAYQTKDESGALLKTLEIFAERKINLTKLESCPIAGKPWEYLFYVDLVGNLEQKAVQEAFAEIEKVTTILKILGNYPAAS